MPNWLIASIPTFLLLLAVEARRHWRDRNRDGATPRDPILVQREIRLEKLLTRLRPNRWYDHALGIAFILTPLSQWIGYQYWGNFLSIALPLIVYVVLHLWNSFDPPRITRGPIKSGKVIKMILSICGLAGLIALMTLLPPLPEIIAIQVTLFDVIGLMIGGLISWKIHKSQGLRETR
jgi:hypothetical protein